MVKFCAQKEKEGRKAWQVQLMANLSITQCTQLNHKKAEQKKERRDRKESCQYRQKRRKRKPIVKRGKFVFKTRNSKREEEISKGLGDVA